MAEPGRVYCPELAHGADTYQELTGSNRITKRENIILPGDTVRAGSSCETVYAIGIDKHGTAFFVNDDGDYIAEPVIEPYSGTLESILAEVIDGLDSRELIRRLGNTDLYHRVQEIRKRARAWREANLETKERS